MENNAGINVLVKSLLPWTSFSSLKVANLLLKVGKTTLPMTS